MNETEDVTCLAPAHLGAGRGAPCQRPAQLVLVWSFGLVAACRACAAVFVLHHRVLWVLPFPPFPVGPIVKEVGPLQLSGKRRSAYLHVLHGIQAATWQPGDGVPTSAELATACRCARSTATAGLRALVADGWLIPPRQSAGVYTVAPAEQWPQPRPSAPAVRLAP